MKTIRYRIYTEDKNESEVLRLVEKHNPIGDSFTVYHGMGVWHGASELSLIIEFLQSANGNESELDSEVKEIAEDIKKENKQEAVLTTKEYLAEMALV